MNIELILWIVAFIVIWEAVYLYMTKKWPKDSYGDDRWLFNKILSFSITLIFVCIQGIIVSDYPLGNFLGLPYHYSRLIWEVCIVGGLFVFFWINKKIADYMINKKPNKTKKKKKSK